MIRAFYDTTFVASVILMLAYVCMWHRHFDIHITLVFVLVPVVNLGYSLLGRAETLESAVLANAMSYIGPCYLLPVIMLSVFSLCHIPLPRWARAALLRAGALASSAEAKRTGQGIAVSGAPTEAAVVRAASTSSG